MPQNMTDPADLNLGLTLKVYQDDGVIRIIRSRRKKAFTRTLKAISGQKFILKVTYGPGLVNEGIYSNKEDLLHAYEAFSNADNVRFIREYNNL